MLGAPTRVQRAAAGRWLDVPPGGCEISSWPLHDRQHRGTVGKVSSPIEAPVTQATLNGRKVVVVSFQDGSKLYVADTGTAYLLRWDYEAPRQGSMEVTATAPISTSPGHSTLSTLPGARSLDGHAVKHQVGPTWLRGNVKAHIASTRPHLP
jgi:hypothetical protein